MSTVRLTARDSTPILASVLSNIPEAVAVVVEPLADELQVVLGSDLVGLYLYGSAVTGGFDDDVSDVDLVAVTERAADRLELERLRNVHDRVVERDRAWANRVEIVYVGRSALASFRAIDGTVAVISPGEPLHVTGPIRDWLQNWYLVRRTGLALVGPPPAGVIPSISHIEFMAGIRAYAAYLAASLDGDPGAGTIAYALLSTARALRTLETGEPCSKQEAAAWLRQRRPEAADLIDRALAIRLAGGSSEFADVSQRRRAVAAARSIAAEIRG